MSAILWINLCSLLEEHVIVGGAAAQVGGVELAVVLSPGDGHKLEFTSNNS